MSLLIPGYQRQAEEERTRQAVVHRIDRLPWAPAFAAGAIHVIDTAAAAAAWAARLQDERVSLLGVDTEFTFDRPAVPLRNGKRFEFLRSLRPQVCSIAAWCGAENPPGTAPSGTLIQLLFDLRRPAVFPGLQAVFDLAVPWVAHSATAELHCLWACGIEPAEHRLLDTYATAACLHLGRFHPRQRPQDADEAIAHARKVAEKRAHITSLVGQCEVYGLGYPFNKEAKDLLRERFRCLGPTDPLDNALIAYAMSDAEFALRLHLAQAPDVERFGLAPHLASVEWPLVGAVARMEVNGLPVQADTLRRYRQRCQDITRVMARRLEGFGIKPGSRHSFLRQMARAGVVPHFVRDGKYSTTEDTLRACEHLGVHPAVRPFRLHLYFSRLTAGELLSGTLVDDDDRLRCSLEPVRSASGRIASSGPNLIGLDKRLRPIVEAPAGWTLIEVDYSQKELGVAGAEWHDEALIQAFNEGDAYAAVAQRFYADQLTPAERDLDSMAFKKVRPELRKRVKVLALGILYGRGPRSIAETFHCSLEHAQAELQRFFDLFPQARDNATRAVTASLRRGYGLTVTGLRRFIEVGDDRLRNAMRNHPIQSAAAAIFKVALARIDAYFRETRTQLLLPRHDSILLLTPVGTEKRVSTVCKILMKQALREKYPVLRPRIDAKVGRSWPTEETLDAYYEAECRADDDLTATTVENAAALSPMTAGVTAVAA